MKRLVSTDFDGWQHLATIPLDPSGDLMDMGEFDNQHQQDQVWHLW